MVYTDNSYEWDPSKAERNFRKHGVRFEEAIEAFNDLDVLFLTDPNHSTLSELRERLIGKSSIKILLVIFTVRFPDMKSRIISARLANRKERAQYEKAKKAKHEALSK
jgi:uncharacterized DUF497 family protein